MLTEQRKLAVFILEATDSFTNRFQHTQQIIMNTHVCLIISPIFYHSKSLTQFIENKQFVWKLVYCAKGDFCKIKHLGLNNK